MRVPFALLAGVIGAIVFPFILIAGLSILAQVLFFVVNHPLISLAIFGFVVTFGYHMISTHKPKVP